MVAFLGGLLFSPATFARSELTGRSNALAKALSTELIKQGICIDSQTCWAYLQMERKEGKKIYLNLYGQKNTLLASKIANFLVEKGLKITGEIPITFKVFSEPKTHYQGVKSMFVNNKELLQLELNK